MDKKSYFNIINEDTKYIESHIIEELDNYDIWLSNSKEAEDLSQAYAAVFNT